MLRICGIGIYQSVSVELAESISESEVFVDRYTSRITDDRISEMESILGKKVKNADRGMLEEKAGDFVRNAHDRDVALLVGGDPLIATTHKILFLEARKAGTAIEIVHSSSVFTASIGESGLDFYRFGQVCTIAGWKEGYRPISFYDKIYANFKNAMHTLILLDYDAELQQSLGHKKAIEIMLAAEAENGHGILGENQRLIMMADIGSENMRVIYKPIGEIREMDIDFGMCCFILHSDLSEIEEEMLKVMCGIHA